MVPHNNGIGVRNHHNNSQEEEECAADTGAEATSTSDANLKTVPSTGTIFPDAHHGFS